jgi:N-acetylglucosamine-6-phosphate deacetylase
MEGGDASRDVARSHARHGTTSILATTMTAPAAELTTAFRGLAPHHRTRERGSARILGVHLEGPFINAGKLGAQPDFARALDIGEVRVPSRARPDPPPHDGARDARPPRRDRAASGARHHRAARPQHRELRGGMRGARARRLGLHAPLQCHVRVPPPQSRARGRGPRARRIRGDHPDLLHVHPARSARRFARSRVSTASPTSTAAAGMPDGEYRWDGKR